jgi:hypothetical protein
MRSLASGDLGSEGYRRRRLPGQLSQEARHLGFRLGIAGESRLIVGQSSLRPMIDG